jgi:hypothetical protein
MAVAMVAATAVVMAAAITIGEDEVVITLLYPLRKPYVSLKSLVRSFVSKLKGDT